LTLDPMAWENNHPTLPHRVKAQVYSVKYSQIAPAINKNT